MALDKSPEMEGLTPAERAALYKQRAAAAGIGRPPSAASQEGAAPARPAAVSRPAAAPAPAASAATETAGSTATLERPAGGGVPAKVAQAATARRQEVAAVARRDGPSPSHKEQSERLVYVWPHLVTIEFLSAVACFLAIIIVSLLMTAPLEGHANPDRTPNPSKAPWYFLNLQELLLHMHPALAGVLIPSIVLFGLIPLIPYIDRDTSDVGKWFGTPKAKRICTFSAVYSFIVLVALIFFTEFYGVKELVRQMANATGQDWMLNPKPLGVGALSMADTIVPMIFMNTPIVILVLLVRAIFKPDGIRDYMFALFTGFVVAFFVLMIVSTFFRGQGMHLMWPWDPLQRRVE